MKTKLPTKEGNYWWRESDSTDTEDWQPVIVVRRDDDSWVVVSVGSDSPVSLEDCDGQWSPCPKPDEGYEAWEVRDDAGDLAGLGRYSWDAKLDCIRSSCDPADAREAWNEREDSGYTCKKVRVFKEVEG